MKNHFKIEIEIMEKDFVQEIDKVTQEPKIYYIKNWNESKLSLNKKLMTFTKKMF